MEAARRRTSSSRTSVDSNSPPPRDRAAPRAPAKGSSRRPSSRTPFVKRSHRARCRTWCRRCSASAQLASLAPVVTGVADAGDLRANALVSVAVEELVLHLRTLSRTLFGDERAATPTAFTGGLLRKGSTLRRRLEHRLRSAVPGAQIHAGEVNPARGAVRGALRYLGETVGS